MVATRGSAGTLEIQLIADIARLQDDMRKAQREIRGMTDGASRAFNGLGKIGASAFRTIAAAAAGISAVGLAREFLALTDESKSLTAQLRLATAETGGFAKAQEEVRRIAADTRSDLAATGNLYGSFNRSAQELGKTQKEAAAATEAFSKALKIGGAGTAQVQSATLQLGQALASANVQWEELGQILEASPRLAKVFTDSLGVTRGELKKMAEDGKLSSDMLFDALTNRKYTAALDAEFAQLPVTFEQAMGQIHNAAVITFGAFDQGGQFSTMLSNFLLGSASDFAALEASALSAGITVRSEFEGILAAMAPVISDMKELIALFDQGEASSGGMFSKLFSELDAISAWYADNQWLARLASGNFLAPLPPASQTNLSQPYEDKRRQTAQNLTADAQNQRWNDAMGWGRDASATNASVKATNAAADAKKKHASASERLAERLARESAATEALISGLYKSVAAYGVSEAAGRKASIEADAMAQGMKRQADVAAYTAQQLRKAVAELVTDQAKSIRQMVNQTDAQELVNKAVLAGGMAAEDAADALAMLNEQRALTDTIKLAELNNDAKGAEAARKALAALADEQLRALKVRKQAEDIQATAQTNRNIDLIRKETELQRQVGEARMKALRGLSGDALEDELQRIADWYERQNILMRAQAAALKELEAGHWANAAAILAEGEAEVRRVRQGQGQQAAERTLEQNRRAALNAAYEIADIIGGSIGDAAAALADAIIPLLDVSSKLGAAFEQFSKGARLGGALGGAVGSSSGGAIGGGLGQVIGKELLTKPLQELGQSLGKGFGKLGEFAGPLGAIAGGILGGVIGGMLKSTPRASATVSIIAGKAMETAISGNSASLKKIAGEMADGLLSGLNDIAEQLGADLIGDAAVSVGIRKKNYRVDTTGSGITKTSKGAIDFGEDKAAAVAYALLDAIKDGVLGGLSASLEKLITSSDDLESNLKKALSFKGVFDTLAERDDPAKWAQDQVTKWHDGIAKIFAEAGATADELAALERLTGIKRADAAKEAADKIAQAQREALEQENALASMRVTLLELQGKSAEALDLSRQIELSTMTEAERVIQRQIHAEQDLAKVRDEAAAATEAAAAKWQSNYQIALGLTGRLLELDGDVEALRARELQQIPEQLRYLQELIWAREDEAKATDAATKAAEELAAKNREIADELGGLDRQWLQVTGNVEALRAMDLAGLLSDEARAKQKQIWAYEDAQKAAQAEIEARNQQIASIRSTIDALSGAQAKWMEFAANIREFRAGLFSPDKGSGLSVQQARADFDRTAKMAAFGDEKALQSFTGVSQTFLDAARSSARSQLDYQRAIGLVAGAADAAAKGADGVGAQAANEYAALQAQITQLEALNEQTTATVAALAGVGDVQENEVVPTLENVVDQLKANGKDAVAIAKDRQAAEVSTVSRLESVETLLARLLQHLQEETTAVTTSNTPATPIYVDQVP